MRYFLLAGEASGDNLGALLIDSIREKDPGAEFMFWGGDAMSEAAASKPRCHIRDLAFMGFVEVLVNLPKIIKLMRRAKRDVNAFDPHVLVTIDYPGFNLRLAKWAKGQGIRVDHYVSPQIWAWRQSRVHKVIKSTNRVLCLLPFEQRFYASYGYKVNYTGHPLPKRIDTYQSQEQLRTMSYRGASLLTGPVVALLPGSRLQEVSALLPIMVAAVNELRKQHPELQAVIAAAPSLQDAELFELSRQHDVGWSRNSYEVLSHADAACVASGTATLETALFGVPQVVCYRAGKVSVALARFLIKVDYISLVNLILEAPVVPELIQEDLKTQRLRQELEKLLVGTHKDQQLSQYRELRRLLAPYDAADAAATLIVEDARAVEKTIQTSS